MLKRSLFVLVCLLLLGATSSTTLAGPPWPAMVITPTDGWCVMPWLAFDDDGEANFIDVYGTYSAVYQPKTGIWNASCHLFIDFNDPSMLSIGQVCAMFPNELTCKGGTLHWTDWECIGPYYGLLTYDSNWVVNPSGHSTSMCHFKPHNPYPYPYP